MSDIANLIDFFLIWSETVFRVNSSVQINTVWIGLELHIKVKQFENDKSRKDQWFLSCKNVKIVSEIVLLAFGLHGWHLGFTKRNPPSGLPCGLYVIICSKYFNYLKYNFWIERNIVNNYVNQIDEKQLIFIIILIKI